MFSVQSGEGFLGGGDVIPSFELRLFTSKCHPAPPDNLLLPHSYPDPSLFSGRKGDAEHPSDICTLEGESGRAKGVTVSLDSL